jgi:hypothetical protein
VGLFSSKKSTTPSVPPQSRGITPTWPWGQRPGWLFDGVSATYYDGRESLDVVGESHYQDALWAIVEAFGGVKRGESARVPIIAILVAEDGNPHDSDAVAVWVSGALIGYIDRELAPDLRQGLLRLQAQAGAPIAIKGNVIGGGPGRSNLGVFLDFDPADFGIEDLFEDDAEPDWDWRPKGHRWDVVDQGGDSLGHIAALDAALKADDDPVFKHYAYEALERTLYRGRDVMPGVLVRYDEVCEAHAAELSGMRAPLIALLGDVPHVTTFRQASIRWQKAHDYSAAANWARRGLEFYQDSDQRQADVADLEERARRNEAHRTPPVRSDTPSTGGNAVEVLACQSCGIHFEHVVTRGRKPRKCDDCRTGQSSTPVQALEIPDLNDADMQTPDPNDDIAPLDTAEPAIPTEPLPPADWYPDPSEPTLWRYWDGRAWTEHVAPR